MELLACFALLRLEVITRPAEIAHALLLPVGYPHRTEVAAAQQARQLQGIAPVGLDALARRLRDARRGHHLAGMAAGNELAVEHVVARPGLVAEQQQAAVIGLAELGDELLDFLRRVGNLPAIARLPAPRLGDRDRNRLLVHVQANVGRMAPREPASTYRRQCRGRLNRLLCCVKPKKSSTHPWRAVSSPPAGNTPRRNPGYAGAGKPGGGCNSRPLRYFTRARERTRYQRCRGVNCSAVWRSVLKKAAISRQALSTQAASACG